jgi:hypothetical protein
MSLRLWLGLALCTLCLAAPSALRADDDLKAAADRIKIAAQKVTAEVGDALARARTLERTDPAEARLVLDRAQRKVRDSQEIGDDVRDRLTRQIAAQQRQVDEAVRVQRVEREQAAEREAGRDKFRTLVGQASQPGKGGVTDIAAQRIAGGSAQAAAADRFRIEREQRINDTMKGVITASRPIAGSVEFPSNWEQLTESRKKIVGPKMTEKEIALVRILNSTLSVDFDKNAFKDVINYLQDKTGLAIIIDEASLKDAMVDYDDPVSFKINKVTVRTVLRKVLADKGLSYILKEGTVQVMTAQKAREHMVIRTYPIDDLVGPSLAAQFYGPFIAQAQMAANVNSLIQMIQNSVEPSQWQINGGPGSITYFAPSMSLIIRASAEMHYSLGDSLRR